MLITHNCDRRSALSRRLTRRNSCWAPSPRRYDHYLATWPWTGSHDKADKREHTDAKARSVFTEQTMTDFPVAPMPRPESARETQALVLIAEDEPEIADILIAYL